jgi:hypothetical protein
MGEENLLCRYNQQKIVYKQLEIEREDDQSLDVVHIEAGMRESKSPATKDGTIHKA